MGLEKMWILDKANIDARVPELDSPLATQQDILDAYIDEHPGNPEGFRFRYRLPEGPRRWAGSRENARKAILDRVASGVRGW